MDRGSYIGAVWEWVPRLEDAGWEVGVVNAEAVPGLLAINRPGIQLQASLNDRSRLAELLDPENF